MFLSFRLQLLPLLLFAIVSGIACQAPPASPAATETPAIRPQAWSGGRYEVDAQASRVAYTVAERFEVELYQESGDTFGNATAIGVTDQLTGQLTLDVSGDVPQVAGELVVDLTTLDSGDERRDAQIQERWLESARFPLATFRPTAVANLPPDWRTQQPLTFELLGELTIREVTRPVSFQTRATLQESRLTGQATAQLLMTDFGFEPPHLLGIVRAANEVELTINLEALAAP